MVEQVTTYITANWVAWLFAGAYAILIALYKKEKQLEEWKEKDFEILMNSEALFARKFSIRHIEVVDQILNEISK